MELKHENDEQKKSGEPSRAMRSVRQTELDDGGTGLYEMTISKV